MDIPRDFNKLTQEQLMRFAKMGFDSYWDLVDRLLKSKEVNSRFQHISNDIIEIQKTINKLNQKLYNENSII